jgi:hypothetical protein
MQTYAAGSDRGSGVSWPSARRRPGQTAGYRRAGASPRRRRDASLPIHRGQAPSCRQSPRVKRRRQQTWRRRCRRPQLSRHRLVQQVSERYAQPTTIRATARILPARRRLRQSPRATEPDTVSAFPTSVRTHSHRIVTSRAVPTRCYCPAPWRRFQGRCHDYSCAIRRARTRRTKENTRENAVAAQSPRARSAVRARSEGVFAERVFTTWRQSRCVRRCATLTRYACMSADTSSMHARSTDGDQQESLPPTAVARGS